MESSEKVKSIRHSFTEGGILEQDPPIIVGGGGSGFVWIRKDLATQVTDLSTIPSSAPHPLTKTNYIVYKVNVDLGVVAVSKGDGSLTIPISLNARTHSIIVGV